MKRWLLRGLGLVIAIGLLAWAADPNRWLSRDQQGYLEFRRGDYSASAKNFTDPMWRGVALYRDGEFKAAAQAFAALDTAEAEFNRGNAYIFLGQYEEAIKRYQAALEKRPEWSSAEANLELARRRKIEQIGGEGTGGMQPPDEVVFSEKPSEGGQSNESNESGGASDDQSFRALWLRNVETRPADFMRVKFGYQAAVAQRALEGSTDREEGGR
jgi:Ca-activated chloride channel family protein